MKLGILDLGLISLDTKETSADVLNNTFSAVQLAEELGFERYWLAEHHAPDTAWRNTDLMVAMAAGFTDKIKVGSAGVIVSVNNPYRVANNFRLASALYSDRIELGLARGSVTETYAKHLLDIDIDTVDLEKKYEDLILFSRNQHSQVPVPPYGTKSPTLWALSSGAGGMANAITHNLDYCISLFHGNEWNKELADAIKKFRDVFYERNERIPNVVIACAGVCSDTNENAELKLNNFLGNGSTWKPNITGSPEKFHEEFEKLTKDSGVENFVFCDLSHASLKEENLHHLSKLIEKEVYV
ncbi:LLM class flavin-dependent oxidoreductase [Bernardetia sp.]|uniref:LLM class flavin-dependent oxidoreductase n=1 Tax=Bernardetia sp. TaxID=1937974 RepID=UPI0025C52474|nr:LLM class flavin-dependent oxidoreductase [Bernardetia sp.]